MLLQLIDVPHWFLINMFLRVGFSWCLQADKTPTVYLIKNLALPAVLSCRDLGITITHDLSPSMQITDIVAKAHKRGNAILRCFMLRDVDMLTELIWCTCAHCLK